MWHEERTSGSISNPEVPISCEQCEEPSFPSLRSLVAHMKDASDHEPLCRMCNVSFKNYLNFGAHIRLYHIIRNENPEFQCELCEKSYKTKHLLNNHCNIVHKVEQNLRCNICEKPYQNIKKLKIHTLKCLINCPQFEEYHRKEVLKREKEESYFPTVAEESKKSYSIMTKPEKDMLDYEEAHEFEQLHRNKILEQKKYEKSDSFSLLNELTREIKNEKSSSESSDNEPDSYEEDNCENDNSKVNMLAYGASHLVELKMKEEDDVGKKEFNVDKESDIDKEWDWIKLEDVELENNPFLHEYDASFEVASPIMKKIKIENTKKYRTPRPVIVCPVCTANVKHLNAHMRDEHPGVPQSYSCKECSKVFSCRRKWYMHNYSCKNEPCLCDICSKIFKNSTNLKQHKEKVHEKKTNTPKVLKVCPICAKELVNLNGHMKDFHSDQPDGVFPCTECGKIYVSKKKLNNHRITAHREDPKMCTVCSLVFKNGHALGGHMRTVHEDTEEQTCPICFKTFQTKMKLYGHNRIVHQKIRSVPIKCTPCGVLFKNKTLFRSHQRESPRCQEPQAEYDKLC